MKISRVVGSYRCRRRRGNGMLASCLDLLASSGNSGYLNDWGRRRRQHRLRTAIAHSPPPSAVFSRFFLRSLDLKAIRACYDTRLADKLAEIRADADRICRHEFNFLGTGLRFWGNPIEWDRDPVSGHVWGPASWKRNWNRPAEDGSDVKVPWELSRMQHLPTLAKAFVLLREGRYAREFTNQVREWINANPCPVGVNWTSPMEASIRILNVLWAYGVLHRVWGFESGFEQQLARSVFEHGHFIRQNLEFGLTDDGTFVNGNHYLSNLVALLHIGLVCPGFRDSAEWRELALTGLVEEMDRQVLPDGGSRERSTAYHHLVLELFTATALLCKETGVDLPDSYCRRLSKMYDFLLHVIRPDGRIPLIGDSDDSRVYVLSDYGRGNRADVRYLLAVGSILLGRPDLAVKSDGAVEEALWRTGEPPIGGADQPDVLHASSASFPDFGLFVLRQGADYLAVNAACSDDPIGAHRHNDVLSFELCVDGRPIIVDPGSYSYTGHPGWRNLFRSTGFHNTIKLDGLEQNELDPTELFRLPNKCASRVVEQMNGPVEQRLELECWEVGRPGCHLRWRRLFLHRRESTDWTIRDRLTGAGSHSVECFLHLNEGVRCERVGQQSFSASSGPTFLRLDFGSHSPIALDLVDAWVSPAYGVMRQAQALCLRAVFENYFALTCRIQKVCMTNEQRHAG